jgi:hypothetical protein
VAVSSSAVRTNAKQERLQKELLESALATWSDIQYVLSDTRTYVADFSEQRTQLIKYYLQSYDLLDGRSVETCRNYDV